MYRLFFRGVMQKNSKYKISDKSQRVITFFGYWWVTFSVLFGLIQLSQWAFNYVMPNWWIGLILFIVVCAISTGISFLLLKQFPNILDKIFNKLPENRKYYDISKEEELVALKAIIYSNLSSLENDETLLLPLKILCEGNVSKEEILQSIRVGLINSSLFHRLGKKTARVLNGIYTLYALEKAVSNQILKETSARYCYVKNYILINDLGWGLSNLSDEEYSDLKHYVNTIPELSDLLLNHSNLSFDKPQKNKAIENIESAKRDLLGTHSHEKLIAQAIRHLLNIDENYYTENNLKELDATIDKIKNDDDRLEMKGNACYLRAVHTILSLSLDVSRDENQKNFNRALNYIIEAQDYYESLTDIDDERVAKCFNVKGKLYLKYAEIVPTENFVNKAVFEFERGLKRAKRLMRYDQVLRNLLSLVEIFNDEVLSVHDNNKSISYAKEGIKISETLKNKDYKLKFLNYYRPKHIILIRHGESEKNIDKVVNGEGHLTEFGKRTIMLRATLIKDYLKKYKYKNISIYGHDKLQVRDSIDILKNVLSISNDKCYFIEELKPTDMGILKGVKESDEQYKSYLTILEQWRNRSISIEDLTKALKTEAVDSYWNRANNIVSLIKENECSVVVCTTSMAILLTHYLTNSEYSSNRYVHIDVPLGGIIHFVQSMDENKYELINKESLTNINFVNIE
ncbi:MAG: histidine phosphatase family protein [Roseburia sp.]|nr:histidine phosphatase family protein [Roseburia sp.]